MKVILCFSGGGMLGLQSAYIVKEIEKKLGKKLINSVDFVAGTSIGSIYWCSWYSNKSVCN